MVGRASASAQGSPGRSNSAGAELELDAVERFKLACVRLAFFGSKEAGAWTLDGLCPDTGTASEIEAGQALVDLALDHGDTRRCEDSLAALLRPDPDREATAWTVACYRVGDLVPHALRDYRAATDAVRELVECGAPAHVAAELVASGGDGVWWTALVRTGTQVRFQLAGSPSITDGGSHASRHEHASDVEAARGRWAVQLASWCTSQSASASCADAHAGLRSGAGFERVGHDGDEMRVGTPPLVEASSDDVIAAVRELTGVVATVAESIERLERQMGTLERRVTALAALLATRPAEGWIDADQCSVDQRDADQCGVDQFGAEPVEAADEPLHRWWPARRPHPRRRSVPGPGRTSSGLP